MNPRKYKRIPQPTPKELTDSLLDFLRSKFYNLPGDEKCFAQDRSRLLAWVVLWPASWLTGKGVTLHGDRYREIFRNVFLQAAANMVSKVKYRPAYLRQVIQKHFAIHGEEYYEEAKSVRALIEQTLLVAGLARPTVADPVADLAHARRILASVQPKKTTIKTPVKAQLNLFS